MILCPLCGMERTDDGGPICPWHTALGATWGAENRIWCDFVGGSYIKLSDFDLGWLVGILEGEGCFTADRHDAKYETRYLRITLAMTDEDVMKRAATLLGARVMGPYSHPVNRPGKPIYRLVLVARKAEVWMRKLLPHMGERRAGKIRELLEQWGQGHNPQEPPQRVRDPVEDPSWCEGV